MWYLSMIMNVLVLVLLITSFPYINNEFILPFDSKKIEDPAAEFWPAVNDKRLQFFWWDYSCKGRIWTGNKKAQAEAWTFCCSLFMYVSFCVALSVWNLALWVRHWGNRLVRISWNKQIIRTHFPRGKSGSDYIGLVPVVGLEPTRIAPHDFESRSSANSDTPA